MTKMFQMITPFTYWILILLWSFILYFYVKKMWDSKTKQLFQALVVILAIDAFRTLFESLYFGLWYTSLSGLIPAQIGAVLTQPELVIIPKIINVAAAVIIILLLLKKWLPEEELEQNRLGVALQHSEEEFRALFENNPVSCWLEDFSEVQKRFEVLRQQGIIDIDAYFNEYPEKLGEFSAAIKITNVNQATLDLHKAENKEQLLQGLGQTFTAESFEVFRKEIIDLWNGTTQNSYNGIVKTLDGDLRYVQINYRVLPGYESTLGKVLISLADNTKNKQAEKTLIESQAKYKALFNSVSDAIFIYDPVSFEILDANEATSKLYGYDNDELIGMSCMTFSAEVDQSKNVATQIAQTGHANVLLRHHRKKDGTDLYVHLAGYKVIVNGNDVMFTICKDITESRLIEEALIISEARYRTLVNTIPDLIWLKDVEGVYLNCNEQFERFFGAKESEIIGKTDYDFNEKELADFFRRHDLKAIEADGPSVNEEWLTFADNGYRGLFEAIKTPMRDTNGNVIGVLGISRDITERKDKDRELKNLIRDQNIILDNVPTFIIFKDTQNNIIKVTHSAAVITGLPKKEIEGRPSKEVYPDMADSYWEDDLEVIRAGKPKIGYVEPLPTADGKTKWLLTDKIPYFEDDKVVGILVISTDISERIEYENRLKESEMRFRSLFENAADAIYLVSMEGKILDVNSVAQKQTGYSKKELLTMEVCDLDARTIEEHDRERIWENIELGEIATLSTHHLKKDKSRIPVEISLTRFEMHDDIFLLAFVRDVTKKLETERQLRQSQKHESIGTLAGGIAHDFNNILASIVGYTELALEDAPQISTQHENLKEVLAAGGRAKELVQQILAFARKTDETIKPIELGEIVSEVTKLIRSSIPTTIEIVQVFESTSPIMANSGQIHQVLMNLYTNAAHAMEENGGVLEVTMKNVDLNNHLKVLGKNLNARRYVKLVVTDTGIGIDPAVIDKIFDPYFTTKDVGEGTGLGLAMVKGIIENHEGHIEVSSIPKKKTSFVIYLPITEKRETQAPSPAPVILTGNEHILFVDDDSMIVKMGSRILERLGYTVTGITSSQDALELFKENASSFDLVITDMTMPHLTGDILAMEIRKIRPEIPIILCSGYSSRINKESARDISINAFLNKPISKLELSSTVRQVIDTTSIHQVKK